jgi:hypothetical protein
MDSAVRSTYVQLCRCCWSFTVLPIDLGLSNPQSVLLLLNSGSFPASQLPSFPASPPLTGTWAACNLSGPFRHGCWWGSEGPEGGGVTGGSGTQDLSLWVGAAAVPSGPESTIQTARETDTWVEPGSWRLARPFSFSTISTLEVTESQC